MSVKRTVLIVVAVVVLGMFLAVYREIRSVLEDPFVALFDEECSVCHGENLEGTPIGTPLVGVDLVHGDSIAAISKSIAEGSPARGMPAWSETLDEGQVRSLAILILETRANLPMGDFRVDAPLVIPEGTIVSERHDFRIETLKATELYRMVLRGNEVVHTETLVKNLARIRDVETGPDGAVYLLLEPGSGGQIVRLVPEP